MGVKRDPLCSPRQCLLPPFSVYHHILLHVAQLNLPVASPALHVHVSPPLFLEQLCKFPWSGTTARQRAPSWCYNASTQSRLAKWSWQQLIRYAKSCLFHTSHRLTEMREKLVQVFSCVQRQCFNLIQVWRKKKALELVRFSSVTFTSTTRSAECLCHLLEWPLFLSFWNKTTK